MPTLIRRARAAHGRAVFPHAGRMGAATLALMVATLARATDPAADAPPTARDRPATLEAIEIKAAPELAVEPTAAYVEGVVPVDVVRNLSPGPATSVQTLLNEQPSIFAYANGPLGVETSIYFRAFNTGQFSETFAGVSINDIFNSGVTGQAENRNNVLLTPNNVESVQLYRGINNPAVNSYNSLGGTINFNPRQPGAVAGGEFGMDYGNLRSWGWHASVDTGDWNGVRQTFSFAQTGSDGWIRNAPDHNNNLYWGLVKSFNADDRLYNYFLYNNNRGYAVFNMPQALIDQNGYSYQWPMNWTNSVLHDSNWLDVLGVALRAADGVRVDNKFFVGRNEYLRTSFSNPAFQQSATQPYNLEDTPTGFAYWLGNANGPTYDPGAVFGSAEAGTDFHFYGYTADALGDSPSLTLDLPHNEIVVGGNLSHGKLYSREFWYGTAPMPQVSGYNDAWNEHDTRTLASLYVQDEIALLDNKLHATPGVKYLHATTSDHDDVGFYYPIAGTVSDSEHFVSPSLGLNLEAAAGLNVFLGLGKNIKLPDISAYYGAFQTDGKGNPQIVAPQAKPEYVNDVEAGLRYQAEGLLAEFNVYRENFENTFVTSSNPNGLTLFHNGGSSRYQGIELQLRKDFKTAQAGDWRAYLNYAHNQAYFTGAFTLADFGNTSAVLAGQPLAGVPQNLLSVGAIGRFADWRVNLDGRYVGKQYIDQFSAGTPTASTISAFTVFNLGVTDTIALGGTMPMKALRCGLHVDNLFDRRYLNTAFTDTDVNNNPFVRGIYAAPRTYTLSAALEF